MMFLGANGAPCIPCPEITGSTSDGHHTFDDLYAHRLALTMALFRALGGSPDPDGPFPWRSLRHHDDTEPFGGGWFIVGVTFPGPAAVTYHYRDEHWHAFDIEGVRTLERAPVWDGHTPQDVIDRLTWWARDGG